VASSYGLCYCTSRGTCSSRSRAESSSLTSSAAKTHPSYTHRKGGRQAMYGPSCRDARQWLFCSSHNPSSTLQVTTDEKNKEKWQRKMCRQGELCWRARQRAGTRRAPSPSAEPGKPRQLAACCSSVRASPTAGDASTPHLAWAWDEQPGVSGPLKGLGVLMGFSHPSEQ